MKRLIASLAIFIAVALAQLDPTGVKDGATFDLFESGNKVGEIYVPARAPEATHYYEHWVLFANYVYPEPRTLVTLDVVPRQVSGYRDAKDFLTRVAFGEGSRYVKVTSDEYEQLPGRRF